MSNYEYLGKKEIYKRVQALGYEMPKISDFDYIKYDCIEWMQSHELKITVQRGGEWLQVVEKRAHVRPVTLFATIKPGNILRVTTRDILYPFLSCQKSSMQPLELSDCRTLTNK